MSGMYACQMPAHYLCNSKNVPSELAHMEMTQ